MGLTSRYSQHARRALSQARLLAQAFQHPAVDTDHLLVGILREKGSLGFQVLDDLEVDARQAERAVRNLHAGTALPAGSPELTMALRRVLSLSIEESRWFGHHYVGTEHLLLALARSGEGGAASLLSSLAISPDQIRRRVRLLLRDGVTELSIEAAKRMARLSELSRRVLNAAGQLVPPEKAHTVRLEHLLLVLARERRSMASRILWECGLDYTGLEAAVGHIANSEDTSYESVLEDVIDHAVDRADQLGMHYTGTDHILLALAQHPYGARLLWRYGVDPAELIAAVYRRLSPPPGSS